mgnify:FL=1|tara:strand:- start:2663 stop:3736 length:1074 start_codon:yes stop_codon:yes gene_type:complete
MAIVLRSVKGSALTHAELDANFTDLNNRVLAQIDSSSIVSMAKANSLDSAEAVTLITGTIDSNYVQARQTTFDFTANIDSAYVQARQVDLQRDSNFITNIITTSYIRDRQTNNLDSAEAIALIDSAYVQARQVDLQRDSAFVTNIVDAAYVQARQVDLQRDSAFITSVITPAYIQSSSLDSTEAISLIDSAYVQARQSNDGVGLDSSQTIALIDSAYVLARAPAQDFLDSSEAIALIDSAYVLARAPAQDFLDSSEAIALIDSAHVTSKTGIGNNNIDFGANRITYANLYDSESLLPAAGTYHGMFAHVHATGDAYFSHGGAWHKLIDMAQLKTTVAAADSFGSFKTLIAGLTDYSG